MQFNIRIQTDSYRLPVNSCYGDSVLVSTFNYKGFAGCQWRRFFEVDSDAKLFIIAYFDFHYHGYSAVRLIHCDISTFRDHSFS